MKSKGISVLSMAFSWAPKPSASAKRRLMVALLGVPFLLPEFGRRA
jgi:hypothetical protein